MEVDRGGQTPDSNLLRKLASLHNLASAVGTRGGKGGHAHGIRSLGSSALDMVMVASGSVDIMWEGGCALPLFPFACSG